MHIEASAALALAVVAHAWITRIQAPAQVVNAVAWVFALLVTLLLLIGAFAR